MIRTWHLGVVLSACIGSALAQETVAASRPATRPQTAWAEVLEEKPDPKVVKDPAHRGAILSSTAACRALVEAVHDIGPGAARAERG